MTNEWKLTKDQIKYYSIGMLFLLLISACTVQKTESSTITLVRKPYLQSAIADSITILWRTNVGGTAKVAYREKGKEAWAELEGITRPTNTQLVENEVSITNLTPSTTYEYQIFTDEIPLDSNRTWWFTSPVAGKDTAYTFFAVGDIGEPVELGGTPDLLAKALEPHVQDMRFGLLLGDIIYPDGKSELYDKNLFQYFGAVFPYVPVFPVLGNHDWHEPEENYIKEWKLPGNEHYYSFAYGNAHFIALDTKNGELYDYEAQVKWLEKDLSNIPEEMDWTIVFLHHNGISCTYKDAYEGVVSLYPIFEKYEVDLVLNGHAHTYERLNPMTGEGEVVRPVPNDSTRYQNPEGFISITVGSGGKLRGVGSDPKPFTPDPDSCQYPGLVAAYSHQWAFLKLEMDGKKIIGTAIGTEDQEVIDVFQILK